MAHTDKNILITPSIGSTTADPKIVFSGADASTAAQNITLQVYPTNSGTLSFEGSAGQLFSITNSLSGTIYSVNDISGIPSIEVLDTGLVKLAQYSGNVLLGTGTDNGTDKLQVNGSITGTVLKSTVATGTAPLTVASTTTVTNLSADMLDGLHLNTSGRADVANQIVRTDASGYIQAGWINTTSGDNGTTAIARIYASSDAYIRYYTPANFKSGLSLNNVENTALSTWAGTANITTVGTIGTGTWNATNIGLGKGGTNASLTAVNGGVVYSTASAMGITAAGTSGYILMSTGASAPVWSAPSAVAGTSGYSGYSGQNGASGFSGISGYSGTNGGTGASGFSGISGYSGWSGISGFSGKSGYSGTNGTSGYSGYSGWSGAQGPTVYPGSGVAVSTGTAWGTSLSYATANTVNALVQRDASGNFSAGTATLGGVNLSAVADTATAASHYYVETATDSAIRPKTLANVQSEIVTSAVLGSGTANSTTYLRGDRTWATISTGLSTTDDTTTNATYYPIVATTSGGSTAKTSSTKLTFNPSTGDLSATNINSLSDQSFKEDVQTIENAIELLVQLRGVSFKWKDSGIKNIGVIAQEIEQVLPEVVVTLHDGRKTVSYGNIVGLLIEVVKNHEVRLATIEKLLKVDQ